MHAQSSTRWSRILTVFIPLLALAGCFGEGDGQTRIFGTAAIPPSPGGGGELFDSGLLTNGDFEVGVEPWIGNAANVVDDGGNFVNSANIAVAGAPFDVNLSQVVAITPGETYTLTFKARSNRMRTILAGIGLNEAPFTNVTETVNLTADWQTFEFEITATGFGNANSRVLFDMGADTGLVLIDDVSLVVPNGGPTAGTPIDPDVVLYATVGAPDLVPPGDYDERTEFGSGSVINASYAEDETYSPVLSVFSGTGYGANIAQVGYIGFATGFAGAYETLDFKVKGMPNFVIFVKLFDGVDTLRINLTSSAFSEALVDDWFQVSIPLSEFSGVDQATGIVFESDDSATMQFHMLLTDIGFSGTGTGGPGEPFDSGLLTNGDFEAGVDPWIGNAANVVDDGGNNVNSADVATAGDAFAVNLSQVLTITQGETYTLTFKARSDGIRTMLAGIGLNEAPFTNVTEIVNLTAEWQTFEFEFTATDFGNANSRVLFDMGADTGLVLIDDVSLVVSTGGGGEPFDSGLLTNGDFEAGVDPWIGNAANVVDDGGNNVNSADVATAGDPFAVNLSQVLTITQGETYTLTFKARSDGTRTMLAGIGLNEAPFTNVTEIVNLTAEWQTFEFEFTATDFGNANSRVLFDMGADTGLVLIDDVSLVVSTGGGVAGDIAVNGGFESGDFSGWEATPGGGIQAITTVNPSAGTYAANLNVPVRTQTDPAVDNLLKNANLEAGNLTPGDTITVSFDMRGSLSGAGGVVFAELFSELSGGGTSKAEILSGGPLTPNTDWTAYSFTTTLGGDVSGGVSLQLKASCGPVEGCGVDVFFDNVSIVTGSGGGGGTGGGGTGGGTGGTGSCGGAGELAINCDFETGDFSGWELFPGGGIQAIITDNPSSGTYAANLNVPVRSQTDPAVDNLIKNANLGAGNLTPGASVTVSFDMRGSLSGAGGVVFAEFFSELTGGGTSKAEIFSGGPLAPNTNWTNYSYTTTLGPDVSGGVTLQLKTSCGPVEGCGVDAYFDNVSIVIN